MRIRWTILLALAGVLLAGSAVAAVYKGRDVDGHWFEGRATNTTFGAYDCEVKFNGDRALIRLRASGLQIVGMLEEEVILDPHDITVYDPLRGIYWTLSLHDLVG